MERWTNAHKLGSQCPSGDKIQGLYSSFGSWLLSLSLIMSEFHSLANLIKRLEVATTRLEDLAMSASSASAVSASSTGAMPAHPPSAPTPTATSGAAAGTGQVPLSVQKHDEEIMPLLQKFLALSTDIGGPVSEQVR